MNNNATVTGTITITDVSNATWNEKTNGNKLVFNAAGKTLNIGAGVTVADLTLNANGAKLTIADTATFTNTVVINAPATVVSSQAVITKIATDIEVTLKADEADAGIPVTGTGAEAAPINPSEINDIMDQLQDGMLDDIPYPGDQGEPGNMTYTLASFIGQNVEALTVNKDIKLSASNYDENDPDRIPYGYYEVTLTIAGATTSKMIKVDTLTVETAKSFKDAMRYDINKIILANDIETDQQILITKSDLVIDGNNKTITAATGMTYSDPNKSVLTVLDAFNVTINNLTIDASNVNTANKWDGVYAMQVYNSDRVIINDITLKNGDAGLLINGSDVLVTNITTSGNEFGGIEVAQGSEVSSSANLTVVGTSTHDINENIYIWTIGDNATVEDSENQYKYAIDTRVGKDGYVNFILKSEDREVPYAPQAPTIISIEDISETVVVNDNFILPSTVVATMSDNTTKIVAVTWDPTTANTGALGEFTFSGEVDGFEEGVTLTLTVSPLLSSATIAGSTEGIVIDGLNISVPYTEGEAPGLIVATFLKDVELIGIKLPKANPIVNLDFTNSNGEQELVTGIIVSTDSNKDFTVDITRVIDAAHITKYGNEIVVTLEVVDTTVTYTITLVKNI